MPEPLLLSLPPVRLDWAFRLDAHCWHLRGGALLFLLILLLSSAGAFRERHEVTLCGVALSAFVSSITAAILILDEQTLLAMRTWLAGDLAGQDWATLGASALVFSGDLCWPFTLHPPLTCWHWAIAWRRGWASVLRTRTFTLLAIALLSWRSRIDYWPHWFCRPASTADCPASGISGSARSAPSFSLCRRAFVITGRYYCRTLFTPMS